MHNNTSVIIFMHFSFSDCDEEEVRGFDTRNQGQHKASASEVRGCDVCLSFAIVFE